MQFKDYYKTLGVSRSATAEEIKSAFRKLARKHHPDVAKPEDRDTAEARFKEVNEAYEVLGDAEKRQKYDTLGADWDRPQPPPGWRQSQSGGGGEPEGFEFNVGGTGFSDFFEAFFGSGGRHANPFSSGRAAGSDRGVDVEADLMVTLEEALRGARRKISLQRGGGEVQSYEINIPAGVRAGQRIRLAGQGEPGLRGGTPGDLYLNVRLAPHPDFRLEGADLIHELEVAPWKAVLGCEEMVRTMEGSLKLKIPAHSQPGKRFRIRGHGMPKGGGERGDLYVVLTVRMPESLTPRQRELWESLSHEG